MITVNGENIDIGSFPDGTILMKHDWRLTVNTLIEWRFENDRELLALIYLVKHLRNHGVDSLSLYMPYIPNARQDRVKGHVDVFTLKYFAEIINSLDFNSVMVLDPHSNVSTALINKVTALFPKNYIEQAIAGINGGWFNYDTIGDKLLMFYPDEGSVKRYSDGIGLPYAFGIKKRNWETGKIEGLDVAGAVDQIAGKDILIVDDICSRGGTFYHSAKKLKELGAKDIYLYVSHCENTILEGDLLKEDLVKKIYTTDSIFTKNHEKIEVLK